MTAPGAFARNRHRSIGETSHGTAFARHTLDKSKTEPNVPPPTAVRSQHLLGSGPDQLADRLGDADEDRGEQERG
jgi:hypothetical protein